MEILKVTTARDQEQFNRILNNLISANKEFQIMITVPSASGEDVRADEIPLIRAGAVGGSADAERIV